jgi:hypothetical protein
LKYLLIILSALVFIGCSSKDIKPPREDKNLIEKSIEIYDLLHIPQNVSTFTKSLDNNVSVYDIQKQYEKSYFSIWNINEPPEKVQSIKWPFFVYRIGSSYGENLQLLDKQFFDQMYENSNFDTFATVSKKAITLKHSDLRLFPTHRPLLKDPSLAGEGFPFDYMQNSSIEANEPLFVSHYSKNKEWVYVFSNFASGWLEARDIVFLDQKYTDIWQKAEQVFMIKDDVPIFDNDGNFLFNSKIGMMFSLIDEDKDSYTILTVSNYRNSTPLFLRSTLSKEIAHKGIFTLGKDNLEKIMNGVFYTNYGWGGMYGQRDCSSMLRDLFAPFGIWLPRNSYQQSKIGEVISLENLSDEEKVKLIKEKAVPFQTLLYKKGHIVLYVGTYNDEIVVFHDTWGIKTKKDGIEGRIVIGKTIFSTLKLGKNQDYYDKDSELLRNLKSMNILTN